MVELLTFLYVTIFHTGGKLSIMYVLVYLLDSLKSSRGVLVDLVGLVLLDMLVVLARL